MTADFFGWRSAEKACLTLFLHLVAIIRVEMLAEYQMLFGVVPENAKLYKSVSNFLKSHFSHENTTVSNV